MGAGVGSTDGPSRFTEPKCFAHAFLTRRGNTVAMKTHGMKIRRHLRSVRTSALSEEERRLELREAEARSADGDSPPAEPEAPPSSGDGASRPAEARARRPGVGGPS